MKLFLAVDIYVPRMPDQSFKNKEKIRVYQWVWVTSILLPPAQYTEVAFMTLLGVLFSRLSPVNAGLCHEALRPSEK